MGIFLIILGAIIFIGSIVGLGYFLHKFNKSLSLGGITPKFEGNNLYILLALVGAGGIGFLALSLGMVFYNNWAFDAGNYLTLVFGALFFGLSINTFIAGFDLYFVRKDLDPKQRKIAQISYISAICLFIAGLWMWTDSIAYFVKYPLPNSISFSKGFGYPDFGDYGFTIAFYGIIIVGGALISYFVVDHHVYAKFGKHGLIDTLFLVAFPMGLIGARLWWCFVLEPGYVFGSGNWFLNIVDVRNGGLAIQGGAILGMISGILFALKFRKYMNIRWLVDVAIPTILIAQAVGRWGNFFNQEVYGKLANPDTFWFLPKMIAQNMYIESSKYISVPLFLIESVINIAGFFIIRYAYGHGLKRFAKQGDQAFLYLVWYGAVRAIMEPLSVGFTLNLGHSEAFGYLQSWIMAFSMLGIGILGIIGIRVFEYIRRKNGKEVKEYEVI